MKVFHYHNSFKSIELHKLVKDYGESSTDKTYFRPEISTARARLGSLTANSSGKVGAYDFPDGKDNGEVLMTFLRSKCLDPTELDNAYAMLKTRLKELQDADIQEYLDENQHKSNKELVDSLRQFLTRDSAVDVVSQQNNTKTSK